MKKKINQVIVLFCIVCAVVSCSKNEEVSAEMLGLKKSVERKNINKYVGTEVDLVKGLALLKETELFVVVQTSEDYFEWSIYDTEAQDIRNKHSKISNCKGRGAAFMECCVKHLKSGRYMMISTTANGYFKAHLLDHP